jgi:anti-sigma B factor antagonist
VARQSLVRLRNSLPAIQLQGEFDLSNSQPVADLLDQVIEDAASRAVLVDLSEVTFLDSRMLQVLVSARDKAQTALKPMWLVRPAPQVWRVFQVTMLDKLFRDFESVEELESHAESLTGPLSAG